MLPGKDANRTLQSVHLRSDSIDLVLPVNLSRAVAARIKGQERVALLDQKCVVTIPISLPLRGGRRSISIGQPDGADHDATLITALRKAHAMLDRDERGQPMIVTAPKSPYQRRLLRLAFLAPDIQQAILAGHQPRSLNLEQMIHQDLPNAWSKQREMLGFALAIKTL